jgi:AcrR family transcriptional regulator
MQTTLSARDRILSTALRLFYSDGIRATGIDRIIAESGVAKMSFYRHFPSKNDLIRAFLDARHEIWMEKFRAAVERRFAQDGLKAIAHALAEWFAEPDFRGCAFINTVAESGAEFTQPIEHKQGLEVYARELAERLSLPAPDRIAAKAMILIEGAIVRAQMGQTAGLEEIAAQMFTDLTRSSD